MAAAMLLLIACEKKLERSGIPIWAGISIDSARACSRLVFQDNLDRMDQYQLAGCLVEIPLTVYSDGGSQAFTYYEGHSLDTLVDLLKDRKLPYGIHFHLRNPFDVSREHFQVSYYLTDMSGLLLRTAAYPPEYIVFSGKLLDPVLMDNELERFLLNLREAFTPFQGEIVLAAKPFDILAPDFPWDWADAVGILYPPPAEQGYKDFFRDLNSQLSQALLARSKPAMVVHSNLLGEDKTLLFKNQMRFWAPEVELRWINLNTLYCQSPLTDSSTYFSLGRDREFLHYLKSYLHP